MDPTEGLVTITSPVEYWILEGESLTHYRATYYEFCLWADHPWGEHDKKTTPGVPFENEWALEQEDPDSKTWYARGRARTSWLVERLSKKDTFGSRDEAKAEVIKRLEGKLTDLKAQQFAIALQIVEWETGK